MRPSPSSLAELKTLHDFLIVTKKLFPRAGFSKVLQTHPDKLLCKTPSESLSYNDKVLTYRYKIPDYWGKFPLSGFLGLFDDITTWAIVQEDKLRRPGVSTSMHIELGPGGVSGRGVNAGDVIDVNARVVKIGQNLGFASAEAIDVKSGEVICVGKHTKFLPMGFIFETAMGRFMPWTKMFVSMAYKTPEKPEEIATDKFNIDDLLQIQQMSDDGKQGTFRIGKDHVNYVGAFHGACQAMIMEVIGREAAKRSLKLSNPLLRSITVSYMSAGKKEVTLDVDIIDVGDFGTTMEVVIKRQGNSTVVSEGILKWENFSIKENEHSKL